MFHAGPLSFPSTTTVTTAAKDSCIGYVHQVPLLPAGERRWELRLARYENGPCGIMNLTDDVPKLLRLVIWKHCFMRRTDPSLTKNARGWNLSTGCWTMPAIAKTCMRISPKPPWISSTPLPNVCHAETMVKTCWNASMRMECQVQSLPTSGSVRFHGAEKSLALC